MNSSRPASPDDGIRIRGATRAFGDVRAVSNVSLHVRPGEVVGLLGPNGAGKTTLLRMVATLLAPDSGTIEVAGHDTREDSLAVRASLGYQTGDTGLYERLTPREFLTFFGTLHGLSRADAAARADRTLHRLDATGFADKLCEQLSTGQKQRVVLARTLLASPPALVLDEPTSGLDLRAAEFILNALRAAARDGRAVLFSTHHMSEVEILCDRVAIMHRGTIVAEDTIDGIRALTGEPTLAHAFLALTAEPRSDDHAPPPDVLHGGGEGAAPENVL